MQVNDIKAKFLGDLSRISALQHATSMIQWDAETEAPKNGVNFRAKNLGILTGEIYRIFSSDDMKNNISILENESEIDEITKGILYETKKTIEKYSKIPSEELSKFNELRAKASVKWEEAKSKSDFEIFAPYLEELVSYLRKFVDYRGYKDHPYNTLLDDYEPGMTVEKLDQFFSAIRKKVVPLLERIKNSDKKMKNDFMSKSYNIEKQKEFSLYILEKLKFDLESGVLKESEHPFTLSLDPSDVRLTTHFYEDNFISAIFSTIHEAGHAIYEQNIDKSLSGTALATGTSMGIHESQSRTYENVFGRNINFWKHFYNDLIKSFNEQLDGISLNDFYEAINEVKPSLIRIEADELTYSLHVMVRYEIEKALFEGKIEVKDLPSIWNEKMKEYLGIEPGDDGEGVLQDVHWAGGMFGYFPSYALGNAYAAQFEYTMRNELNLDKLLQDGKFDIILNWLREKIHKHGKLKTPNELIKEITGKELDPKYFVDYLEDKYSEIYSLK